MAENAKISGVVVAENAKIGGVASPANAKIGGVAAAENAKDGAVGAVGTVAVAKKPKTGGAFGVPSASGTSVASRTFGSSGATSAQSIARIALTIAIMAVSAWVSIPLGPVPFTLQCFAVAFALCVLPAKECLLAVGGYLVLGAFGVPVFSSMRGGISVLAGVTGGFLWGYFIGALAGLAVLSLFARLGKSRSFLACICACFAYLLCTYVCGTVQFMGVAGASVQVALAACVLPFVVVDCVKLVAACITARAVDHAIGINRLQERKER